MSLKQIIEGWRNNIMPPENIKDLIGLVSEERLSICNLGTEHSSNKENYKSIRPDAHCTNCGCTLSAKTKCLSCKCPLNKWDAVLSPEQEEKFKENG